MATQMIPLVGGPRDGALVPLSGPSWHEPIPDPPVAYRPSEEIPAEANEPRIREYRLERWRHTDGQPEYRYVLVTADLGQPSFEPRSRGRPT